MVVLVELPDYDGIRMIGNLPGDPEAAVSFGADVGDRVRRSRRGSALYTGAVESALAGC